MRGNGRCWRRRSDHSGPTGPWSDRRVSPLDLGSVSHTSPRNRVHGRRRRRKTAIDQNLGEGLCATRVANRRPWRLCKPSLRGLRRARSRAGRGKRWVGDRLGTYRKARLPQSCRDGEYRSLLSRQLDLYRRAQLHGRPCCHGDCRINQRCRCCARRGSRLDVGSPIKDHRLVGTGAVVSDGGAA
jgi:hypothetical protein